MPEGAPVLSLCERRQVRRVCEGERQTLVSQEQGIREGVEQAALQREPRRDRCQSSELLSREEARLPRYAATGSIETTLKRRHSTATGVVSVCGACVARRKITNGQQVVVAATEWSTQRLWPPRRRPKAPKKG